jgi:alkaline phosphatase
LLVLTLLACASAAPQDPPRAEAKNVVLLVGDGMGFSQVTLARVVSGKPLHLDGFPTTGFQISTSADHCVTDSAAAATALASGTKTRNFAIGIDADGKPLRTILEEARDLGKATGLVTTSKITHATPACFAAHVSHRSKEADIAKQYLDAGVDVLLGGGGKFFDAELRGKFAAKGYAPAKDRDGLAAPGSKLLGLFDEDHVPYVLDREAATPSLVETTRKALDVLSKDPDGFFLMIEGARIDMACHASDAASCVKEMLEFDEVCRLVREFAAKDGKTLVVVTADHATGALAITEKVRDRVKLFDRVRVSAEKLHDVIRQSPRAASPEQVARDLIKEHTGVDDVTDDELKSYFALKRPYDPGAKLGEIVSKRLGVTFIPLDYRLEKPNETHGHDGAMVPIYAFGPGAACFGGTLDNTDIPKRIREIAGYK